MAQILSNWMLWNKVSIGLLLIVIFRSPPLYNKFIVFVFPNMLNSVNVFHVSVVLKLIKIPVCPIVLWKLMQLEFIMNKNTKICINLPMPTICTIFLRLLKSIFQRYYFFVNIFSRKKESFSTLKKQAYTILRFLYLHA